MKKYSILIFALIPQVLYAWSWLQCNRFIDNFHFSMFDLSLRLIEAIHNDGGLPIQFVRIFHNKLVGAVMDTYKHYLFYWDIQYLAALLSFIGIFGFLFSLWYGFAEKKRKRVLFLIILSFSLLLPFVEILMNPNMAFPFKLFLFASPLMLLSLFGWMRFLERGRLIRYVFFFGCFTLSMVWLQFDMQDMYAFCLR